MLLGRDPLRIWLHAITVSSNALLRCYWAVQTLPCKLLATTVFTGGKFHGFAQLLLLLLPAPVVCAPTGMLTEQSGPTSVRALGKENLGKLFSPWTSCSKELTASGFCWSYAIVVYNYILVICASVAPITVELPLLYYLSVFPSLSCNFFLLLVRFSSSLF